MTALDVNPQSANISINDNASNWLWAVFAVMLLSDLIFIVWAFRRPVGNRLWHQIPIIILTTSAIAYFAMASGLGHAATPVQFTRGNWGFRPTRAIWYARYIQWIITAPFLVLMLLLATAMPLGDIVVTVFMSIVTVVTRLIGALVPSNYKWGFYTISVASLLYVVYVLLAGGRRSAGAIHATAGKGYTTAAAYLSFLWLLFPIAWGLSEGGNVISPTGEMIFYGILDLLTKPVFCVLFVMLMRRVPYELYGLHSGKASNGLGGLMSSHHDGIATGRNGGVVENGAGVGRRTDAVDAGRV